MKPPERASSPKDASRSRTDSLDCINKRSVLTGTWNIIARESKLCETVDASRDKLLNKVVLKAKGLGRARKLASESVTDIAGSLHVRSQTELSLRTVHNTSQNTDK